MALSARALLNTKSDSKVSAFDFVFLFLNRFRKDKLWREKEKLTKPHRHHLK